MSIYNIPHTLAAALMAEVDRAYPGRTITFTSPDAGGNVDATVLPDLPAAAADLVAWLKAREGIDPGRMASVKGDVSVLRAYYQNAGPTNAESVAAIKAIVRVLRAMLDD